MTRELEAPCKDCENRKFNCHSSCKKYLDYQAKNEKRKAIEKFKGRYFWWLGFHS